MADKNLEELLAQSSSTDIQVALTAKENAKRAVVSDPSPANLAALERASRHLESVMAQNENLKNADAVVEYCQGKGRKVGRTKVYEDARNGLLKKQADGSFRLRDVERYLASLPIAATPDRVAESARQRQRRKEEGQIKSIELGNERQAFQIAVEKGKYVKREAVHLELAARAVGLQSGLKTAFEARCLEIIAACDGNPKKSVSLVDFLCGLLDTALHEYAREMELEVEFDESLAKGIRQEGEND